jgi:hypothetical protein
METFETTALSTISETGLSTSEYFAFQTVVGGAERLRGAFLAMAMVEAFVLYRREYNIQYHHTTGDPELTPIYGLTGRAQLALYRNSIDLLILYIKRAVFGRLA